MAQTSGLLPQVKERRAMCTGIVCNTKYSTIPACMGMPILPIENGNTEIAVVK